MKKRFAFIVMTSFMCSSISAQRYFEANDIRYRVITDADEASTYGTVSVAKPEVGEYEDDIKIPNVVKESNDQYADAYKVISIDEKAFAGAKYLESVELPPTIETIGKEAFMKSSLKKIMIPVGNLTEIDESVFEETKLKSLEIPTTIKKIGNRAFANCFDLADVVVGEGLTDLGKESFMCCYSLESVSLPNSLRIINDDCFEYCYRVNKLTLGTNLKSIGNGAFYYCMSLRHVDLPEGLKEIGEGTFAKSGLVDIKIPESIREIKKNAFANSMLRSVSVPQRLRSIEKGAFYGLFLNNSINMPEGANVAQNAFDNTVFDAEALQNERKKYLKSHQKDIIKEIVTDKDIQISRGNGGEMGQEFLIIVKGIAYCPSIIPLNDNEIGTMCMCGDSYSVVIGRGGDSYGPQMKSEMLEGDVVIPDIIEIKDGLWKGKYVVSNMNVMDIRDPSYKFRIKSARFPVILEYSMGEILVGVNDTELSFKSNIKATSREAELGSRYKEDIENIFRDINSFLDNQESLNKFNTSTTYAQEFLRLYNDARCWMIGKNMMPFYLNELNADDSYTRNYVNELRKKLLANTKKLK